MKSGVYTITNIINNKIYVGSTNNFVRRFNDHKKELINNIHKNDYLQKSYNKHGKDCFIYEILEECQPEIRLGIEQYWMNMLNVCNRKYGYNLSPTAGNNLGYKFTNFQKQNISKSLKIKFENGYEGSTKGKKYTKEELDKIYQTKFINGTVNNKLIHIFNTEGNFLFSKYRISEIAKITNVDKADILRILNKKQEYSKNYIFLYKKTEKEYNDHRKLFINNNVYYNPNQVSGIVYDIINNKMISFVSIKELSYKLNKKYTRACQIAYGIKCKYFKTIELNGKIQSISE